MWRPRPANLAFSKCAIVIFCFFLSFPGQDVSSASSKPNFHLPSRDSLVSIVSYDSFSWLWIAFCHFFKLAGPHVARLPARSIFCALDSSHPRPRTISDNRLQRMQAGVFDSVLCVSCPWTLPSFVATSCR